MSFESAVGHGGFPGRQQGSPARARAFASALVSLPIELSDAPKTGANAAEERAMHGKPRVGQAVVRELPVSGDLDQARPVQVTEMA
jgi:hypothetical protein